MASYSDLFKAQALTKLKLNNGNVFQTAKELNMPEVTLRSWANGDRPVNESVLLLCEHVESSLIDLLENASRELAANILKKAKADEGSISQQAGALDIVIRNKELLKGQPTAINSSLSAEQKQAKIDEIRAKREAMRQKAS